MTDSKAPQHYSPAPGSTTEQGEKLTDLSANNTPAPQNPLPTASHVARPPTPLPRDVIPPAASSVTPVVHPVPETEGQRVRRVEALSVHQKARDILADHDGMESNIPIGNPYWELMNRFRTLSNP